MPQPRGRPRGASIRQLTTEDRTRVRTLYFDGGHTKSEIAQITSFSPSQIRHAIRNPKVAPRSGRPTVLSQA